MSSPPLLEHCASEPPRWGDLDQFPALPGPIRELLHSQREVSVPHGNAAVLVVWLAQTLRIPIYLLFILFTHMYC